ncbi:hypothetical protein D3C73_965770 [compost metagenome]
MIIKRRDDQNVSNSRKCSEGGVFKLCARERSVEVGGVVAAKFWFGVRGSIQ